MAFDEQQNRYDEIALAIAAAAAAAGGLYKKHLEMYSKTCLPPAGSW